MDVVSAGRVGDVSVADRGAGVDTLAREAVAR